MASSPCHLSRIMKRLKKRGIHSVQPRKCCMINFLKTGDVVLADLGKVAKVRPCVVLCARPDSQRNLAIIAPLTTDIRGGECEIAFQKPPWLAQECVLNLAGIFGIELARIQRRLGPFPREELREAKRILAKVLDLQDPPARRGD